MPWKLNANNEFEYAEPQSGSEATLNEAEQKDLAYNKASLYKYGKMPKDFEDFLLTEGLKPISFTIAKADGTTEEKVLTGEETLQWLNHHKDVFKEAGREVAPHLLAFAIKNGLTDKDIYLLKDHPEDNRCPQIKATLEKARKEMFELVSSEDIRIPENTQQQAGPLNNRETKVVDFYVDYFVNISRRLAEIKQSDKTNLEKTLECVNVFKDYQSLTLQTMSWGGQSSKDINSVNGDKITLYVNQKLAERGMNFKFENIANFGRISNLFTQASTSLMRRLDEKQYETEAEQYRLQAFANIGKMAYISAHLADNLWNSSKSSDEVIKDFSDQKTMDVIDYYNNMPAYLPGYINTQEGLLELRKIDDMQTDLRLDEQLSKFASQIAPYDFETELHSLADSFGIQSNPMDPGFNDMTKALTKLSQVYNNPQRNQELELTALRYAQQKAWDYLELHPEALKSDSPKPAELLAEKIFTLAGSQKLAVRGNLAPGTVFKGNSEYKDHDLSL